MGECVWCTDRMVRVDTGGVRMERGLIRRGKLCLRSRGAPALRACPARARSSGSRLGPCLGPDCVVRVPFSKHRPCVVNGEKNRCPHKGKRPDIHQPTKGNGPLDDQSRAEPTGEAAHMRRARAGPSAARNSRERKPMLSTSTQPPPHPYSTPKPNHQPNREKEPGNTPPQQEQRARAQRRTARERKQCCTTNKPSR